jgi:ATP-binding cassette subfamily F protein uup
LLVSHDRDFLDRVATSTLAAEGSGKWAEYAGGYTDMLAQRGEAAAAPAKPRTTARTAALPPTATATKLSFKQQHELKTLTAEIEQLQFEISRFNAVLAEPGLYTRDIKKFRAATNALAEAQEKLAASEERWLELEVLREAS